MKLARLSSLILVAALASCSSKPSVTDTDILVASNRGELDSLYQQLQTELKDVKPSSDKATEIKVNLAKVGKKIAEQKEAAILDSLHRDIPGQNMAALSKAMEESLALEPYDNATYLALRLQLEQAYNDKQLSVEQKEAEFKQLGDDQLVRKVQLLDEIAALYGGDKAKETEERKAAFISDSIKKAQSAMRSKRYEDALTLLTQLETITPDNPELEALRKGLSFGEYEQQLWDALAAGNTDEAYSLLMHLAKVPDYLATNPDVVSIADDIAQYFVATGNKAMSSYSVITAYQAYAKARAIKVATGKGGDYTTEELKFIEFIAKRAQGYITTKADIPAYGYLSILEEFDPDHALVIENGQRINNAVLDMATVKILASPFKDDAKGYHLGDSLVKALSSTFEAQHRRDITVKTDDVAPADREKINQAPNALSYYYLTGEILQAGVQTMNDVQTETRNVLVSHKRVENPEYIEWTKLSSRKKRETPEPPATIEVPVNDSVAVEHTLIDKNAEVYSTYRVVDHTRADVFVSDALQESVTHSTKATKAIDQGLYQQEAVNPEIAEDQALLEQAVNKTAVAMAKKILESREKFLEVYVVTANTAMQNKKHNEALTYYSLRNVLNQAEGIQDDLLLGKMRLSALYWK